ncbi:MAG: hypothetical protein IID41_05130 [Planctomycetes bacterium]|nr:hypothetical protein [Planctomycetota bacterium]
MVNSEDAELDPCRCITYMGPAMAIHAGMYILRCFEGDCTQAVANIEQALPMEDPAFEIQCFPEYQEVTIWMNSQIIMTLAAQDAEEVALQMMALGVELFAAQRRVFAQHRKTLLNSGVSK